MGLASWNSGKRNEMKRVESRRNHVVSKCSLDLFFWWFCAWSHICLWNCDRRMEQILTAELSDIFTASGRMYSDFIFVAGMYPEFENGKHMGSLKGQLWGIDCPRGDATKHWKFSMTNGYKWRECHELGHLGKSHWIFRCPRHASIIFLNQNSFSCHHEII